MEGARHKKKLVVDARTDALNGHPNGYCRWHSIELAINPCSARPQ